MLTDVAQMPTESPRPRAQDSCRTTSVNAGGKHFVKIARITESAALRDLYAFRYRIYVDELRWLEPYSPACLLACLPASQPAQAHLAAHHQSIVRPSRRGS